MLSGLSAIIIRFRWLIVAAWIVVGVLVFLKAPLLSEVAKADSTSFLPPDVHSSKATVLLSKLYPNRSGGSSLVLTLKREGGLTAKDRAFSKQLEAYLKKHDETYKVRNIISPFTQKEFEETLIADNGEVALLVANLSVPSFREAANEVVRSIRRDFQESSAGQSADVPKLPHGLTMHVTGEAAVAQEKVDAVQESMALTGRITVILVAIILILIYRSPVAPIVPMFTIMLSFLISRGLIASLTSQGLRVSSFTETFLIAILFGAGTDYCLLIISRFKEELSSGKTVPEALGITLPSAGEAVISSGGTVMVGFAFMIFAKFGLFNTTGPSIAIGVAITILAAMTLTPAMLAILGERVFWPAHPSQVSEKVKAGTPFWDRLANTVTSKPMKFAAVSLIALIPFMLAAGGLNRSFDQLAELPASSDAVKGFQLVKDDFDQGELFPMRVVMKADKDMWEGESLQTLEKIAANISKIDKVASVRTATRPLGEKITGAGFPVLPISALEQNPALREAMAFYIAPDGNGAILDVVLSIPPYTNEALDKTSEIERAVADRLKGSSLEGAEFYVGGGTASFSDVRQLTAEDLINVMVFVLLGIFVILVFLLRSLVAPIYLILTILISFAATMGITSLVFQTGLGYDGLDWSVPFFSFCLLVALGVDYNIFLMSRVKEEYRPGDVTGSVARALSSTGKIITSCGIIMAGTFGALLASPLISLVEVGFATVVGLLLDTFIIRCLLVPAIAVKLGELNWWPGGGAKRIPAGA